MNLFSLIFLSAVTLVQTSDVDRIESIRRFILAAYPDLASRNVTLEIVTVATPLNAPWSNIREVGVRLREKQPLERDSWAEIASLEIHFGRGTTLMELVRVSGSLVNTALKNQATALVAAHPEWDDKRAFSALKPLGAKFIPGETARSVLVNNARSLGMFLGPVSVEEVEFDRVDLTWNVEIATAGDSPARYVAQFEPFNGRLVILRR